MANYENMYIDLIDVYWPIIYEKIQKKKKICTKNVQNEIGSTILRDYQIISMKIQKRFIKFICKRN